MALNLRRLNNYWLEKYGHPILMVETFVEEERFIGGVYRAGNWIEIGKTKGFPNLKRVIHLMIDRSGSLLKI